MSEFPKDTHESERHRMPQDTEQYVGICEGGPFADGYLSAFGCAQLWEYSGGWAYLYIWNPSYSRWVWRQVAP